MSHPEFIAGFNALIEERNKRPAVPVPKLYHYTTAEALKGILDNCFIYASHVDYLNDTSEVKHAIELGKEILAEVEKEDQVLGVDAKQLVGFGRFFFTFPQIMRDPTYIVSFCSVPDLLSQWRAYGTNGFAIEFESLFTIASGFELQSPTTKMEIREVIYDRSQKRQWLLELLATCVRILAGYGDLNDDDLRKRGLNVACAYELQSWIHMCKSETFREEAEWRIICVQLGVGKLLEKNDFTVRLRGNDFVPAIRLRSKNRGKLPISRILCGPARDIELRVTGVRSLLESRQYPDSIDVIPSKVPLRSP
jgi:hypothetical protein